MNVRNFLVSTAAAASVIGVIGMAYAQTADTGAVVPSPAASQSVPTTEAMPSHPALQTQTGTTGDTSGAAAAMPGTGATLPSTGSTTPSDPGMLPTERAAQADRN